MKYCLILYISCFIHHAYAQYPLCFYCSTQPGKSRDMDSIFYVGLKHNLTQECTDICQQTYQPLFEEKDCARYEGAYYVYD